MKVRIPFEIFRFAGKHERLIGEKPQRHNWQDRDWNERGKRIVQYSDGLSWKKPTRWLAGRKSYSQKKLWRATLFSLEHNAALVRDDGNRWISANTAYFSTLLIFEHTLVTTCTGFPLRYYVMCGMLRNLRFSTLTTSQIWWCFGSTHIYVWL